MEGVVGECGRSEGAGTVTKAVWEKAVGILGNVAYVHPLCRRYLHHCYRTLAGVTGRAATWTVRIVANARAELEAMVEILRARATS